MAMFAKAMEEIADGWDRQVIDGLFILSYVILFKEMQSIALIEIGRYLKNAIRMTRDSLHVLL